MTKLQPWRYTDRRTIADMRVFRLTETRAVSPRTGEERSFSVLETGDWVNVIPLTPGGEVILVRQWRHGTRAFTLEIPGGLVDPGEEPAAAAAREVREETGYEGGAVTALGAVETNPAILDNRTHTFLIEGCRLVGAQEQDAGEDIAVERRPLAEIPDLVRGGEITHSLVICGFWWLALRRPDLMRLEP
ncbi:NUDIX domain-containing protein [bacterium]|nr:NUDIX domain-containing protein [bacterium]